MGKAYGRLPSELLDLSPEDLSINAYCLHLEDLDRARLRDAFGMPTPVVIVGDGSI
jgi:hypothetical protein